MKVNETFHESFPLVYNLYSTVKGGTIQPNSSPKTFSKENNLVYCQPTLLTFLVVPMSVTLSEDV